MNARLLILLGLAVILGVGLYAKKSVQSTATTVQEAADEDEDLSPEEREQIRQRQKLLEERDLPGEDPPDPPELSIQVEVDRSSGKNSLCAYITEAHGYYVETFEINMWYKGRDEITGEETRPLSFRHYANKYLKANDTLKECIQVVPAELSLVGGDIGTSEDWDAEIIRYGRARLENPAPLPPL